jgi:hypothetical protein
VPLQYPQLLKSCRTHRKVKKKNIYKAVVPIDAKPPKTAGFKVMLTLIYRRLVGVTGPRINEKRIQKKRRITGASHIAASPVVKFITGYIWR